MSKHNGKPIPRKQTWLSRAVETYNYHASKLKQHSRWTIEDTAALLGRSYGSVNEDLLIASWSKSHEDRIKNFRYAKDALAYIREKKRHMLSTEI